ncbi:MAG: hypothetical protein ACKOUT_10645 [Novosphingobium sp.]
MSDQPVSRLILSYEFDQSYHNKRLLNDDFGWFGVSVTTERFSGRGGMWVQWHDIVQFGNCLATRPLVAGAPIVVQWGYNMQEGDDLIVRLAFEIIENGNIQIAVELGDTHGPHNRLRTSFECFHGALPIFSRDIEVMMQGNLGAAVIDGR